MDEHNQMAQSHTFHYGVGKLKILKNMLITLTYMAANKEKKGNKMFVLHVRCVFQEAHDELVV